MEPTRLDYTTLPGGRRRPMRAIVFWCCLSAASLLWAVVAGCSGVEEVQRIVGGDPTLRWSGVCVKIICLAVAPLAAGALMLYHCDRLLRSMERSSSMTPEGSDDSADTNTDANPS